MGVVPMRWRVTLSGPGPTTIEIIRKPVFLSHWCSGRGLCVWRSGILIERWFWWSFLFRLHRLNSVLSTVSKINNFAQEIIVILLHLIPMMRIWIQVHASESVGFGPLSLPLDSSAHCGFLLFHHSCRSNLCNFGSRREVVLNVRIQRVC